MGQKFRDFRYLEFDAMLSIDLVQLATRDADFKELLVEYLCALLE